MGSRKDVAIQSLRGLAIILMVAAHVIGGGADRGLRVADDSLWRLSYIGLEDLRMPLFTVISGYVYALRPVAGRGEYPGLVRGKVRRLLIPLLTVGALMFVMQLVIPGVNQRPDPGDAWRVYLFPFDPLWFLQAIFLIFLLVGLLDATGRLDRLQPWGIAFAVACVLHVAVRVPTDWELFSINGALRLLPFFVLGIGLHRFRDVLDRPRRLAWALPTFAVAYAARMALVLADVALVTPAARALSLTVGMAGLVSIFLLRHTIKNTALAWLGAFSFGVYLLHVFAAAGTRMVLQRLGIDADLALFVLCLAAGVGLPILFEFTLGRYAIISRLILGQKPTSRPERRRSVEVAP